MIAGIIGDIFIFLVLLVLFGVFIGAAFTWKNGKPKP